ncbi:unnamed protein product, partial [marine sediment metagenome]
KKDRQTLWWFGIRGICFVYHRKDAKGAEV